MTAPRVFVSYSHDSREHKEWVSSISEKLRDKGVDIILDKWEIGLGDDLPKFMEKSVTEADRVLMICTEAYVAKANGRYGGVGYESMVVTGEIVRDLGTSKFIPVIRQTSSPTVLPTYVSTLFYVDLSNDDDLEELLREIHQAPASPKPPLGKNPYALTPSGSAVTTIELPANNAIFITEGMKVSDGSNYYSLAVIAANSGSILEWRRLAKQSANVVDSDLTEWFAKYDSAPTTPEQLGHETVSGITTYSPMFAHALAGVASGNTQFSDQTSLLHDILQTDSSLSSGFVVRLRMPEAAAYVYQALHGAVCVYTMQSRRAIELSRTRLDIDEANLRPLSSQRRLIGWPEALAVSGGTFRGAWKILCSMMEHLPWLQQIFTDETELQVALNSYYLLLNIQEYALFVSSHVAGDWPKSVHLKVPLVFTTASKQMNNKAYRLLLENKTDLPWVWNSIGVSNDTFARSWGDWATLCRNVAVRSSELPFATTLPHKDLVVDLGLQ